MPKSSTTTRKRPKPGQIPNPHPGEILLEEFLKPLGLSQNALARAVLERFGKFADAFVAQPEVQKTETFHASTGPYLFPL